MRRVCVVTGSRAEYGLLRGTMTALKAEAGIALQLVVTGSHLGAGFGNTIDFIRDDGFDIARTVPCLPAEDSRLGVAQAVGAALSEMARAFGEMKPDILVLFGDRFELLAASNAALLMGIPIAHIHGGELTEGMTDDAIRHAITKMASLHFVAAEEYRRRVVQMGEDPARVLMVGAPG